jgi:L-alanine-DL-glutamate epimerase-like enolase superfamily enzyme
MRIDRIRLDLVKLPLRRPYKLAFGAVEAFDTVLVRVDRDDGASGIGEATILTGYTDETIEQAWSCALELSDRLAGAACDPDAEPIVAALAATPFTATAFATAIEMANGHEALRRAEPTSLPLLAILNEEAPAAIEQEVETLLAAGYRTLKVKVGFDVAADLAKLRAVQQATRGRAAIRIDANQGFSRADGCRFAASIAPDDVELFEQACAAEDWDAACEVARVATVPVMLDESIYTLDDVERAAQLGCASIVKLKLMKLGGLTRLEAALRRTCELGLRPVVGNGVATDIGCWMEAVAAAPFLAHAGEMNGFLKPRHQLLVQSLRVESGQVIWPAGFVPEVDPATLAETGIAAHEACARSRAYG